MLSRIFNEKTREDNELREIISSSCCGTVVVDAGGTILRFDENAEGILEVSSKLIEGENISSVFGNALPLLEIFNKKKRHSTKEFEFNGRQLLIESLLTTICNESCFILILRNITAINNILANITHRKEVSILLDNIIEHSYDGIYITDGSAKTLLINKAYERITGLNRENIVNKNMEELVREGYISKSGSLAVLNTRNTMTMNQSFKTGNKALITSKPVFDDKGNIILVITNVRDITELVSLKKRLDEQENLAKKYYEEVVELKKQLTDTSDFVVEDKKMIDVLYSAQKVAVTDITVLLSGESGVGKEVLAKFIHRNSLRKDHSFINVNCGAIPENLIETELFGYVKGAFSGADPKGKKGLFEIADGGSLFLDEIGELPMNMQVKLLRVLQEQEFTRVGDIKPRKVDVRVISATNKDLNAMVENKEFRADLYYRLNVVPLKMPALRERKQDINALVRHFLIKANERYQVKKSISRNALRALDEYSWPGNIRELKNVIERAVVLSNSDLIDCNDLPNTIDTCKDQKLLNIPDTIIPLREAVGRVEKKLLEMAYEEYGNVRDAAKALGVDASTFVRKRKKYS